MRQRWTLLIAIMSFALLLTGCIPGNDNTYNPPGGNGTQTETSADDNESGISPGDNGAGQGSTGVDREQKKDGTITLEGTPEPITLHLFETPAEWPLQFSTYYPEDFEAELVSSGEGEAVRFVTNFAGHRNENAFISVFSYPDGTDEAGALELAATVAADMGIEESPDHDEHPWALAHYHGHAGDLNYAVWLSVGQHGDAYFYVYAQYPLEMGDGFGPRAHLILDEWLWSDTGEPLAN